eukprot:1733020-Pyramimonas_sp.AAC.1
MGFLTHRGSITRRAANMNATRTWMCHSDPLRVFVNLHTHWLTFFQPRLPVPALTLCLAPPARASVGRVWRPRGRGR